MTLYDVGPTLKTLGQCCKNVRQMFCVCWAEDFLSNIVHFSNVGSMYLFRFESVISNWLLIPYSLFRVMFNWILPYSYTSNHFNFSIQIWKETCFSLKSNNISTASGEQSPPPAWQTIALNTQQDCRSSGVRDEPTHHAHWSSQITNKGAHGHVWTVMAERVVTGPRSGYCFRR